MKRSIIVLALLPIYAHADDWSQEDKYRQAAYYVLHVADWAQTRYIAEHPETYSEINSVLGKHPSTHKVDNYFLVAGILHYVISDALPSKYRQYWQIVTIGVEAGTVARNYHMGIKFDF